MTTSRPLRELLGLDPRPAPDRERGALAERHHHRLGRPQLEALLGDVGEQVVGLVELACQPLRDREQQQSGRPERAPAGERPDRELRVCAHPGHSSSATHRTEEGQPRVDRSAAVMQHAVVARAFGHLGPTLRLRRPALNGGDERAEHGDRRVPLERSMPLQPVEPALDGRDATALVHRLSPNARPAAPRGRRPRPAARTRSPPPAARSPRTSRLRERGGEARGPARLGSAPIAAAPGIDGGSGTTRHHRPAAPGTGWSAPATPESPRSRSPRAPRRRAAPTSAREPRSASGSEARPGTGARATPTAGSRTPDDRSRRT